VIYVPKTKRVRVVAAVKTVEIGRPTELWQQLLQSAPKKVQPLVFTRIRWWINECQ